MWALGRIGTPLAVEQVLERLSAKDPPLLSAELAAVAFLEPPAGRPGEAAEPSGRWFQLEDALWTRYAVTQFDDEAAALLLAVARIGGARSQQRLAADAAVPPAGEEEPLRYIAAMEAMGMLCALGYPLDDNGLEAVAKGLAGTTQARMAAAYVLGRCAGPSAELLAGDERGAFVERLTPLATDDNSGVAARAWKAFAALGEIPPDVDDAILGQETSAPWQVEVEAMRALGRHADGREIVVDRLAALELGQLVPMLSHPVLEGLRSLRDSVVGAPELVPRLEPLQQAIKVALAGADARQRKVFTLIDCEIRVLRAIVSEDVGPVESCALAGAGLPTTYGEVLGIEAIVKMTPKKKASMLLTRAEDPRAIVAEAAVAALADVDDLQVNVVLRRALVRPDPGVQAAAAGAIAARAADKSRRDEAAIPVLSKTIAQLRNGDAIEARIGAIEALGSLARTAAPTPGAPPWLVTVVMPLAKDPAWAIRRAARATLLGHPDLLTKFDADVPTAFAGGFDERVVQALERHRERGATGVVIVTDAGEIEVSFDGAPAPIAQAVFVDLAANGFYEGLTFHRVVPAFVVQGGDPRGDGYGGPGFVMPCERSNVRYERGTVGIALAGKDTGGSQFFIAHNREPRLDARYTIIGSVTRGIDVVDGILPYDVIERIEVLTDE
jgi:cyclophilin family peptidyl-prolyl cis-trans isomerase